MEFIKTLKYNFKNASIVEKLIYINISVFILGLLMTVFSSLFKIQSTFLGDWFALSSSFSSLLTKPWALISYGFLHGGFLHILFNCMWLYLFGRLFLDYFTQKQLLSFYILGTLWGGLFFLVAMNFFPLFAGQTYTLVGASAGISAIIIGTATHIPNYQLRFALIGYVKVWHLAAFFVVLDLIKLAGSNAGGHFAHLGGALFGYLYISSLSSKELDIFKPFTNLFRRKKKAPLKTVHNSKKKMATTGPFKNKSENQQQIDEILDKIGKSGYDTLSKEEKEFLFKQGKKQ